MRKIATMFLLLALLPASWASETVNIAEIQVAGVSFGGDPTEARKTLGPPVSTIDPCDGCFDQPFTWAEYGGMKVWYSYDEVFVLLVTSPKFRLRSDLGVGSTLEEIQNYYGVGRVAETGDTMLVTYSLKLKNGYVSRAVLEFTVEDDLVTQFIATPRGET